MKRQQEHTKICIIHNVYFSVKFGKTTLLPTTLLVNVDMRFYFTMQISSCFFFCVKYTSNIILEKNCLIQPDADTYSNYQVTIYLPILQNQSSIKLYYMFFACSFFSFLRYWYVILRTYMEIIRNSLFSRKVEFVVGGNNFFPKIIDRVSWRRRRRRRRCRPWFLLIFFSRDYSRYAILYTRVFVYHYAQQADKI